MSLKVCSLCDRFAAYSASVSREVADDSQRAVQWRAKDDIDYIHCRLPATVYIGPGLPGGRLPLRHWRLLDTHQHRWSDTDDHRRWIYPVPTHQTMRPRSEMLLAVDCFGSSPRRVVKERCDIAEKRYLLSVSTLHVLWFVCPTRLCIVLKRQKISTRFLLPTPDSPMSLSDCVKISPTSVNPSSPNFAPVQRAYNFNYCNSNANAFCHCWF